MSGRDGLTCVNMGHLELNDCGSCGHCHGYRVPAGVTYTVGGRQYVTKYSDWFCCYQCAKNTYQMNPDEWVEPAPAAPVQWFRNEDGWAQLPVDVRVGGLVWE